MVPGHREFFSLLPLYLSCEQDKYPAFVSLSKPLYIYSPKMESAVLNFLLSSMYSQSQSEKRKNTQTQLDRGSTTGNLFVLPSNLILERMFRFCVEALCYRSYAWPGASNERADRVP